MLTFLALVAAIGAVYANHISPCPLTHAEAVAFCASQGSTLASVNAGNLAALSAQAGYTPKWVGSWNGDNYNGACLTLNQGTVVTADCSAKYQAMCNPSAPKPCPPAPKPCESSSSSSCIDFSSSSCSLPDPQPLPSSCESSSSSCYGPRRSSRSSRSSSSRCLSSSSSSYGCDVPFQYVYLTNTITASWTSIQLVTTTTTSTDVITFATVAAYTVTGDNSNP